VIFRRHGESPARAAADPAEPDDATLVELARTDPEAFGVLYDRYCDPIHRYVTRRLYDSQSAEDVTAEVFFKALRALDTYRPQTAPFSAWLYRIAANAVVDVLRARRPTVPLDEAADLADPSASVEQQAIDRVQAERVWAAVDRLTDAQRTAVILRLGQDLPIAEIASRMTRSEGAVKLLLNRGLYAVREDLGPDSGGRRGPVDRPTGDEEVRR
jgi:RNA polymerase sigma-70 factor, ECF subfamily